RQMAYWSLCQLVGATYIQTAGTDRVAPGYGDLILATHGPSPTVLDTAESWSDAWKQFSSSEHFPAVPSPNRAAGFPMSRAGETLRGAVGSKCELPPGKTVEIPFLLAWRYPNKYNRAGVNYGNHYCKVWPSVQAVVKEATDNFDAIREKAHRFRS